MSERFAHEIGSDTVLSGQEDGRGCGKSPIVRGKARLSDANRAGAGPSAAYENFFHRRGRLRFHDRAITFGVFPESSPAPLVTFQVNSRTLCINTTISCGAMADPAQDFE
jgi:hypothetical protein